MKVYVVEIAYSDGMLDGVYTSLHEILKVHPKLSWNRAQRNESRQVSYTEFAEIWEGRGTDSEYLELIAVPWEVTGAVD